VNEARPRAGNICSRVIEMLKRDRTNADLERILKALEDTQIEFKPDKDEIWICDKDGKAIRKYKVIHKKEGAQ